jgi:hypothetical protein
MQASPLLAMSARQEAGALVALERLLVRQPLVVVVPVDTPAQEAKGSEKTLRRGPVVAAAVAVALGTQGVVVAVSGFWAKEQTEQPEQAVQAVAPGAAAVVLVAKVGLEITEPRSKHKKLGGVFLAAARVCVRLVQIAGWPVQAAQSASSGPAQLAHSHPLTLAHHKEYHAGKN